MSFLKSHHAGLPTSQSGMTAEQWLEARRNEQNQSGAKKSDKKYAFLDDSSSEDSLSASLFIKRRTSNELDKNQTVKQLSTPGRPKTSRGVAEKRIPETSSIPGSTVLSRFSQLEKQILSRQNQTIPNIFSSSDLDLDISSDSEIKRDIHTLKYNNQIAAAKPPLQDSLEIAKQKSVHETIQEPTAISAKDTKVKPKKLVTFASKLFETQSTESEVSLDEFMSEYSSKDDVSLDDIIPEAKSTIMMSLDDLEPVEDINGETDDKVDVLNLHTVDELLPTRREDSDAPSYSEETNTKSDESKSSSSIDSDSNLFNVQSIEELVSQTVGNVASTSDKNQDDHKHAVPTPQPKQSADYSDDFHSDDSDDTLKGTDSIATYFSETSEIRTEKSSSTIRTESPDMPSYSDSFASESRVSDVTTTSSTPPRASSRVETAVQTDPVEISNRLLEESVIPEFTETEKTFFKPSQVLNNEALSVLASYSPAVIAVQDMMKQQLAFTRDFIMRSERLHKAAADALIEDYQYSSLEEARELINMQRRKMKLPPRYPTNK